VRLGRSVGWLSQVERGLSEPGVGDLRAFSEALEVPLGFSFANDDAPAEEHGLIIQREGRRSLGNSQDGLVEEPLSPGFGGSFQDSAQRFRAGDSFRFENERFLRRNPVLRRSAGGEPCIVIWAVVPPLY